VGSQRILYHCKTKMPEPKDGCEDDSEKPGFGLFDGEPGCAVAMFGQLRPLSRAVVVRQ
jgi:hypothetical protein